MSRIWLELLEDDLASSDEKRVYSAIRKIAEDDTGDATYIEQRLAEMLLSNLPLWINIKEQMPQQLETDESWQCPFCGDWFTDGETRCDDCGYSPDVGEKE